MRENRLPKTCTEPLFWTKGVWQRSWASRRSPAAGPLPQEMGGQARVTRGVWGAPPELSALPLCQGGQCEKMVLPLSWCGSAPCSVITPGLAHGGCTRRLDV